MVYINTTNQNGDFGDGVMIVWTMVFTTLFQAPNHRPWDSRQAAKQPPRRFFDLVLVLDGGKKQSLKKKQYIFIDVLY